MPVDHPALPPAIVPRAHARKLTVALSFLIVLGALLAFVPLLGLGRILS